MTRTLKHPFNKKLVLNSFILNLLRVESFDQLAKLMESSQTADFAGSHNQRFHSVISQVTYSEYSKLSTEEISRYDQNILNHTKSIKGARSEQISWKYFQYLALMFTEIFLDRYFSDSERLVDDLNTYLDKFNRNIPKNEQIKHYTVEDLQKIAFWSATGSGKTLIMHMNVKQYLHYLHEHGQSNKLNRILLITPNEGLSKQHVQEFKFSGIPAEIFSKKSSDLFQGLRVQIIEITKLDEKAKDKTVALDAFEGNNLVLVDEGHRGSSGNVWQRNRRKLAESGFTFEYSATFGQAASSNATLTQEYARSILFDYSYKYFYRDGYGKNYRILNLQDEQNTEQRDLYLTACLLVFFQQKLLYKEKKSDVRKFNIENPLWVFVGGSVTKTTSEKEMSDVMAIIMFFARFVSPRHKDATIANIRKAISGNTGFLNADNTDVFANLFPFLAETNSSPETIYENVIQDVFCGVGSGQLRMEELKGVDGEIALRIGEEKPFGVINIGNPAKFCDLCEPYDIVAVSERKFATSLFDELSNKSSQTNILIGSKKFSEGWSNWRVSTMGLINMGKSEGSQIIQLFGRGVRLKGYQNSLKRSSSIKEAEIAGSSYLDQMETLNVFGIHANYMDQFREIMEIEGIPIDENIKEIIIPIVPDLKSSKLKVIRTKKGREYKHSGKNSPLEICRAHTKNKTVIDYYAKVQDRTSSEISITQSGINKEVGYLNEGHLELINLNEVYFELLEFKNNSRMFNINIEKSDIKKILLDNSWYEIRIQHERLKIDNCAKIPFWQKLATDLIKRFFEICYNFHKNAWEAKFREYRNLSENDPEFDIQYNIKVDNSQQELITRIKDIENYIRSGKIPKLDAVFGQAGAIIFNRHLFQPLLYNTSDNIKINQLALNSGEAKFVYDLRGYYRENIDYFKDKELYILRNMPDSKGVVFFEAGNFHPDFILWMLVGNKQYVSFVDPKGIFNLNEQDHKINFYQVIKDIEKDMSDSNIILNSFIISVTPYRMVQHWNGGMTQEDFAAKNVYFLENRNYIDQFIKSIG